MAKRVVIRVFSGTNREGSRGVRPLGTINYVPKDAGSPPEVQATVALLRAQTRNAVAGGMTALLLIREFMEEETYVLELLAEGKTWQEVTRYLGEDFFK